MTVSFVGSGRPKGHIRASRDPVGVSALHAVVGSPSGIPDDYEMAADCYDQLGNNSCTGVGYYRGPAMTWARARGIECAPVAALAGYIGGRSLSLGNPNAHLVDNGADPASVVDFATRYGLLPESVRPYTQDPIDVNTRLSQYELEVACEFNVDAFAVLNSGGEALVLDMRAAIARDCPVAFAMSTDATYEGWKGTDAYEGPSGPSLGNHAQYLAGFRRRADVGFDFLVVGSWGPLFATNGKVWVRDTFVVSHDCFDRYAFQFAHVAPKGA